MKTYEEFITRRQAAVKAAGAGHAAALRAKWRTELKEEKPSLEQRIANFAQEVNRIANLHGIKL